MWTRAVAETLLVCWALSFPLRFRQMEFNWKFDLLSRAFWTRYIAGLTVTEDGYSAGDAAGECRSWAGRWHWSRRRCVAAHPSTEAAAAAWEPSARRCWVGAALASRALGQWRLSCAWLRTAGGEGGRRCVGQELFFSWWSNKQPRGGGTERSIFKITSQNFSWVDATPAWAWR